jgi:hypothetical protein
MKSKIIERIFIAIAVLLLVASCRRAVIRVESIPSNTPKGQPLYVAGNFNNWDPGDPSYQMTLNSDSSYTYKLPPGFGSVEYKITRGDWTTVETDVCGYEMANRELVLGQQDSASINVESWNDLDPLNCPRLTLVVKNVPPDTPDSDSLALAGNFNSWNPDKSSVLRRDSTGKYSITIPRPSNIKEVEYKVTRGDLSKAESDEYGNVLPNRTATFGKKDTIELSVEGWVDRPTVKTNRIWFICKKIPSNTPSRDDIILVSNLNSWDPGDRNYAMIRNSKGQYSFSMPKKNYHLEFKFTRENWHSVETDPYGYDIENRQVDLNGNDTVFIEIEGWKDLPYSLDRDVTVILSELPAQTPPEDKLFLAGNFNGFDPNRAKFRFEKNIQGQYVLNIPREHHNMEFKVTRGSWKTIEVDRYGSEMPNRNYLYKDFDTLYISVANWKDKPLFHQGKITIVIDRLPDNTPENSSIYIAGTFNDWNPGNRNFTFQMMDDNKLYFTLPLNQDYIEYKITHGSWNKCEVDKNGSDIPNRGLNMGFADTVHIIVPRWLDR